MSRKANAKIKVAVIYGGRSGEHEVSLQSAAAIIKNIDKNKFDVIPIAIDKKGRWLINDMKQLVLNKSLSIDMQAAQIVSGLEAIKEKGIRCDVIFPVLHGPFGEDGTLQGLCEMLDLPYVGAEVLGSAIAMDKDVAKRLVAADNIPVVPFIAFNEGQWKKNKLVYQEKIQKKFQYPVFVKPANTGSSLGITKVKKALELLPALQLAFSYDNKILIEQAFNVREIEIAVLENLTFGDVPLVSIAGEIIPQHEYYSYEAKYIDAEGAEFIIPAQLQKKQLQQMHDFAIKIFTHLACSGMARIDFFIEKETQKIYFNEMNTIPGFTQISMYPKLWQASGLSYQQLLTHLIELALQRHARKSLLKHF
jgi:D-alanine-D-alanine ligase